MKDASPVLRANARGSEGRRRGDGLSPATVGRARDRGPGRRRPQWPSPFSAEGRRRPGGGRRVALLARARRLAGAPSQRYPIDGPRRPRGGSALRDIGQAVRGVVRDPPAARREGGVRPLGRADAPARRSKTPRFLGEAGLASSVVLTKSCVHKGRKGWGIGTYGRGSQTAWARRLELRWRQNPERRDLRTAMPEHGPCESPAPPTHKYRTRVIGGERVLVVSCLRVVRTGKGCLEVRRAYRVSRGRRSRRPARRAGRGAFGGGVGWGGASGPGPSPPPRPPRGCPRRSSRRSSSARRA